jgi:predicted CoA-binding protein
MPDGTPDETPAGAARAERDRVIDYLDAADGRGPVPLLDDAGIARVLRDSRRIAVIGASSRDSRPSFGVFRYLVHQGYDCVPVNPMERDVMGVPAFRSLAEAVDATGPFDLVDVFRRPELCPPHAEEAVAAGASCLWLQLGVVSWEAATIAHAGGLSVVMDRCTAIEHRRLRGR